MQWEKGTKCPDFGRRIALNRVGNILAKIPFNRVFSEVGRFSRFQVASTKFRVYFWPELVQRKQKKSIFVTNGTKFWY